MGRLTFSENGEFGVKGVDLKKLDGKLYGCICKLKDYEDTGLSPDEVEDLQKTFMELAEGLSPPYKTRDLILELKRLRGELEDALKERDLGLHAVRKFCTEVKGAIPEVGRGGDEL